MTRAMRTAAMAAVIGAVTAACAEPEREAGEGAAESAVTTRGPFSIEGVRAADGAYRATVRTEDGSAEATLASQGAEEIVVGGEHIAIDGALGDVNLRVLRAWTTSLAKKHGDVGYASFCYFGEFDYIGIREADGMSSNCYWATDCASGTIQLMSWGCVL